MFAAKITRPSTHRETSLKGKLIDSTRLPSTNASRFPAPAALPAIRPRLLQTKLKVGSVDDPLEHQADRIADRIMRDRPVAPPSTTVPRLQRKCAACEKEEQKNGSASEVVLRRKCAHCQQEEEQLASTSAQVQRNCAECEQEDQALHRKPGSARSVTEAPPLVHQVLRSPGQSLSSDDRSFFEPRFGFDLSRIRIHADSVASESAKSVAALAYTVGPDIAFASGQYQPGTDTGRRLLAHELAHVVQQSGGSAKLHRRVSGRDLNDSNKDAAELEIANSAPAQITDESSSGILRRQPKDATDTDTKDSDAKDAGAEHVLTRPEEISLSRSSAGRIAGTRDPFGISLYNFAIDSAELKTEHRAVIAELASLIHLAGGIGSVQIYASGNADSTGEPIVNNPLSRHRAMAVQAQLSRLSGAAIRATWHGEDDPVADNSSVDGRSRNRRVDIIFVPTTIEIRDDDDHDHDGDHDHDHDGGDDGGGDDDGGDDGGPSKGFCERHPIICSCKDHPILCGAIGVTIIITIFCALNPELCFGWKLPCIWPFCREKKKKDDEEEKPPKKKACPFSVSLPTGTLPMSPALDRFLYSPEFKMEVSFTEDPKTGCVCNCGEYRQEVRGFVERDGGTGVMVDDPGIVIVGGRLDRNTWLEDSRVGGAHPYGHRYFDATRMVLRPNDDQWAENDKFLSPDSRGDGCDYEGSDQPNTRTDIPGETVHMHLEFQGAPVDACADPRTPLWGWERWNVDGQFTKRRQPPPTPTPHIPKPPQSNGPQGPSGPVTSIRPRPATTRPVHPTHGLRYVHGIPRNAAVPQTFTMHLQFVRDGKTYDAPVPIQVVEPTDATTVTVKVVGPSMEISPPGSHESIVTLPGATATVPRSILEP